MPRAQFPTSVAGPGDDIVKPPDVTELDYEVELVAVIGREAKHVPVDRALEYVAGYMVGNDVSARCMQLRRGGGQFSAGKRFALFLILVLTALSAADGRC